MKKYLKRLLSMMMAVLLCFGIVPSNAFAAEYEYDGYISMIDYNGRGYSLSSSLPAPFGGYSTDKFTELRINDLTAFRTAYCIQLGVATHTGIGYDQSDDYAALTMEQKAMINTALTLGYNVETGTKYGGSAMDEYIATQILIWLIAHGQLGTGYENQIVNEITANSPAAKTIFQKLRENVVTYHTVPSFATDNPSAVGAYADQGITGTSALKRDEFLRLMRDCRQGKIDRILVKSVSRFARNAQDCIEAVRELRQLGVTVYFEKEHINTANMSNEMFLSMMSAFAQEESISISKNMRKGAVMRMKNGTFRLSQAPYGYYLDEKGILIVQQEESKIVQRIFGNFLSGMGIQEIAAELQKEHIPKLNGEPIWSYTGILYILTNERYIGDELFQKRYTTDTLPFQKKINRGQKKQYYAEDTHDPIISREVFRKAQELLKRKSERHGHQNNGQYTFTSLIVCDECGTNFCRRIAKNQRVLWTCRKHFKGKHLCSMESLNETEIQQCFLTLYKKLAENRQEILGSYLRQLEELKDKDFMAHPDAMELNRQIAGLLEQNHTLHRLRAKECIDSAFFIAQSNELSQKISNLKAELKQYRDLNEYADFIDNTRLILTILDSPMPVFSSSVFRNIVSRITVTHETLRFQLVNGLELEEERISGG